MFSLKYFSFWNNFIVYLNLVVLIFAQIGKCTWIHQSGHENKVYDRYIYKGYEYAPIALPYDWETAKMYCQNRSAELVSLHSQAEEDFLKRLLRDKKSLFGNRVWIGLYISGNSYKWSDGTVLDFVQRGFTHHLKPSVAKYACIHMEIISGYWINNKCYKEMGFVCKRKDGSSSVPMTIASPSTSGNCRMGWHSFRDSCYLAVGVAEKDCCDFATAQKRCMQLNGSLVVIEDEDEQVFLTFLLESFNKDTWIGLHYTIALGFYRWVRKKIVSFTNWEPGRLLHLGKEHCVYMMYGGRRSGYWNNSMCDVKFPFICESSKDPAIIVPPTPALSSRCFQTQDWLKQNNSCFKFFNESKTYATASATCEQYGAKLISISDYRVKAVHRYLSLEKKTSRWIGLLKNSNQEFRWINGFQMTMSNWISGMPVTRNELDLCFVSTPSGFWDTSNCHERWPFVCQINLRNFYHQPTEEEFKACTVKGFTSVDKTDDYCYAIGGQNLSGYSASSSCISKGGKLLSIHSKAQMENLKKYLKRKQFPDLPFFIGLSESAEGGFQWADGSPVNFEYWDDAPMSQYYSCVQMNTETFKWNIVTCNNRGNAICSVKKKIPKTRIEKLQTCNGIQQGEHENAFDNSYFHDGYCYELSTLQVDWEKARSHCKIEGAELVSVHSEPEVDFLIKLLHEENTRRKVWIGLHASVDESRGYSRQLKWSDGTLVDFVNWDAGHPNRNRTNIFEKCCNMEIKSGFWSEDNCYENREFICKWKNDTSPEPISRTSPSTPLSGHCKAGWYTFRDSCYLPVGFRKKDWRDFETARQKCKSLNGSLVIVDDEDEQVFLEFLLQGIKKDTWIGLHDDIKSGIYFWVGNKPLNFTNWAFGVPSYFQPQEDCVHMIYGTRMNGHWNDTNCSAELPFICESNKDPAITVSWAPLSLRCIYPQGWLKQGYSCFKLFSESKSWFEASNICEQYGAKLISISDYSVQAAFKYLTLEKKTSSWIGLLKGSNQEFEWVNGFPMTMSSWGKNMPVSRNETDLCFVSSSRGFWNMSDCDTPHPFICQINSGKLPSVEGTILNCTIEGFESVDDKDIYCYQIFVNVPRYEAFSSCLSKGGNLVSIHSKAQVESLKKYLRGKQFPNLPFHIGLRQYTAYEEGFWWLDYSPVNFEYWEDDEPVDVYNQCIIMKTETLKWAVVDCTIYQRQNAICSIKKEFVPTVDKFNASSVNQSLLDEHKDHLEDESQNSLSSGVIAAIVVSLIIIIIASTVAYFHFKRRPCIYFRFQATNSENAYFNANSGLEIKG